MDMNERFGSEWRCCKSLNFYGPKPMSNAYLSLYLSSHLHQVLFENFCYLSLSVGKNFLITLIIYILWHLIFSLNSKILLRQNTNTTKKLKIKNQINNVNINSLEYYFFEIKERREFLKCVKK